MVTNNVASKPGVLHGLRVLDFTQVVAGPACTRILADLGADIIKIDKPVVGNQPVRSSGSASMNVGKRSIAVDTRTPEGLKIARQLVATADVVIENFQPGVMPRLGLGYEDVRAIKPDIVYCSISGFGQTGTFAHQRTFGSTAHAMNGLMSVLAQDEGLPVHNPSITFTDILTGTYAFGAILAALYARDRTGKGQYIDLALLDAGLTFVQQAAQQVFETGKYVPREKATPAYQGKDGHIVINIGETANWQRIATALGHAEDAASAPDEASRRKLLTRWVAEADSVHTVGRLLTEHNAPGGVVLTPEQALAHPYVQEKGMIVEVPDPVQGKLKVLNTPLRFSDAASGPAGPAPLAGQHTSLILTEILGYSADEINRLLKAGVLSEARVGE